MIYLRKNTGGEWRGIGGGFFLAGLYLITVGGLLGW